MQLSFSTTVTENAYAGITMSGPTGGGIILNQNSSIVGVDVDSSLNRGPISQGDVYPNGFTDFVMYAGATWTPGLSGSYLVFRDIQNAVVNTGPSPLVLGEPYVSGPNVKFSLQQPLGVTVSLLEGYTWRAYRLDSLQNDYHFGGATSYGFPSASYDKMFIPQPQVTFKNQSGLRSIISGATFSAGLWPPSSFPSNVSPLIQLYWDMEESGATGGTEWLNYDPHYFLFFYKPTRKKGPLGNRIRVPSGYKHPANIPGPLTYNGLTGPTASGVLRNYPSSINGRTDVGLYRTGWRTTEWPVGSTAGNPTTISADTIDNNAYAAFHPNQYMKIPSNAFNDPNLLPYTFIPGMSGATGPSVLEVWGAGTPFKSNALFYSSKQSYLYFRFAIGIFYNSPTGIRKVVFGPMSDTLRITPYGKVCGREEDGFEQKLWLYKWQARLV